MTGGTRTASCGAKPRLYCKACHGGRLVSATPCEACYHVGLVAADGGNLLHLKACSP